MGCCGLHRALEPFPEARAGLCRPDLPIIVRTWKLETQERGEWSDPESENTTSPHALGELHIALALRTRNRNQPRLQHRSRTLPRSEGVWSRHRRLHPARLVVIDNALLPDHFRKDRGPTAISRGKVCGLSGLPW